MEPIAAEIQKRIAAEIVDHSYLSYTQIAAEWGVSAWMVAKVAVKFGVRRPRGAASPCWAKADGQAEAL
jgi:hypothetical protein